MVFIALVSMGCKNASNPPVDSSIKEATVTELSTNPENYVDNEVKVSGMVTHVCRHGGQKMFITSGEAEDQVRITTGGDMDEFDVTLEGNLVEITGVFKELRIDEAYIQELEKDVTTRHADEEEHTDSTEDCMQELDDHEHESTGTIGQVARLRKRIKESGNDYINDFWIENISMKVIE